MKRSHPWISLSEIERASQVINTCKHFEVWQNGHYFPDDLLKLTIFNEGVCTFITISHNFDPEGGPIVN